MEADVEFIKSWKFMAVIVAVLTVVAIVGVAYGVLHHEEPGFMAVRPHWQPSDFPLRVNAGSYATPGELSAHDRTAVFSAISTVNERLGFPTLRLATGDETWDSAAITVTVGVPTEQGWQDPGGTATIHDHRCEIETANTGTDEILGLVLYHELGHCLGLAHDPWEGSIMRPVQTPTPDGELPPWIDDSDRALLRDVYGPNHHTEIGDGP
jgi:predicted Zn-dependent protease